MKTAFSDHQYDVFYPPGIEVHWWNLARNRLLANILHRESKNNAFLLEVGCGRGVVVKALKERGFNVHGVELADVKPMAGAELLVDKSTDVFDWSLERRSRTTGLLLLDVIEHLPEPEAFLKKLGGSFPNLDCVVITVPAGQELWSNYDDVTGHYRRYTRSMLENLATDLGWDAANVGYFFRLPYITMRLMSWLGISRSEKYNPPGKLMQPLHRLVAMICQLEQQLLPQNIKGSSAFAVFYPHLRGKQ